MFVKIINLSSSSFHNNNWNRKLIIILIIIVNYLILNTNQQLTTSTTTNPTLTIECRQQQSNCTNNIYPYLNDSHYMFPTTIEHVNDMCKMWSRFVDCIRRYISNCFEENRRQLFHKSVENSIDTVHAICSSKLYQNEYLLRAQCFKQISMDYCGEKYNNLITIISNPMANDEHICCTYAQFKQCVNRPLLEECGRKAKNLMDHSMSFLISRCQHYIQQDDCLIQKSFLYKSLSSTTTTTTTTTLPPPVYSESREWPINHQTIDDVEHNVNNKRELLNSHIEKISVNNNNDNDKNNNDNDIENEDININNHNELPKLINQHINDNDMDDDDMIIYTMKPESQIQLLSPSSSSLLFFSSKYFILTIVIIIIFNG